MDIQGITNSDRFRLFAVLVIASPLILVAWLLLVPLMAVLGAIEQSRSRTERASPSDAAAEMRLRRQAIG